MPQVQSRGELPLWMKALAQAMPSKPAWQAALETAPTPGMIEFPLAAKQFADPGMKALIRHILEVAGGYGQSGGGSQTRRITGRALQEAPQYHEWNTLANKVMQEDLHFPGALKEAEEAFDVGVGASPAQLGRLAERMTPATGREAGDEANALLKLLFNPVLLNRYYRGPFPK